MRMYKFVRLPAVHGPTNAPVCARMSVCVALAQAKARCLQPRSLLQRT